jgi:hypothetical protein
MFNKEFLLKYNIKSIYFNTRINEKTIVTINYNRWNKHTIELNLNNPNATDKICEIIINNDRKRKLNKIKKHTKKNKSWIRNF